MLMLGPFAVDDGGRISPRAGAAAAMRFAWRGRTCEARLADGRLHLSAPAGRIPSTAEPGADRGWTVRELGEMPREEGVALRVLPDHRLRLEKEAPPGATASALIAEMVRFALALDPYLERLESAGAGSAKTCPG